MGNIMSEKNFWNLVRDNCPVNMHRVENSVMRGMPDVHYIRNGQSGWIELKYLAKWPSKRFASGLMLNQMMWNKQYREQGGNSWVLIRIGKEFTALLADAESLYGKPTIQEFMNLLTWFHAGNFKEENWEELAQNLMKKETIKVSGKNIINFQERA